MIALDRDIVRWLNHASQHQPLRALAIGAAKYLAAVPPLLLVGVFLWAFSRRNTRDMARAGLAGLGAALALGANQVVGQLVTRARPYSVLASVHAIGSRNGDSSFYSDHTTIAVGTAIGVVLVAKRSVSWPSWSPPRWALGESPSGPTIRAMCSLPLWPRRSESQCCCC